MRCEFFGDIRDLFKYDLAIEIAKELGLPVVFIPMLTPDQGKHGNQRDFDQAVAQGRPGTQNQTLLDYLKQYQTKSMRCIRHIGPYIEQQGLEFYLHKHDRHGDGIFFTHRERLAYFREQLITMLPSSALLLLDPDNGLEVKHVDEKHLLCEDVQQLCARTGEPSILMIYQQFPRVEHRRYVEQRLQQLQSQTQLSPCGISDEEIIFFFLARGERTRKRMIGVLHRYHYRYLRRTFLRGCCAEH